MKKEKTKKEKKSKKTSSKKDKSLNEKPLESSEEIKLEENSNEENIEQVNEENKENENDSSVINKEDKKEENKGPILTIENLHKSYGKKEVLKGLNLEVRPGELFGFIGKNGVGKSTTIDCVIGAKKFESGKITINGYDIKKEPILAKYSFGYVASEPLCYEVMTGYEYLEFIASIYNLSEKEFSKNYKFLANRLMLKESDLENKIKNYSHGMKQKLCLIGSLLHNPDVWILDEPTVGLDIMATEELKAMMREYANHGKCVFVTSHNIELVSKICDRVGIVNNGVVQTIYDLNKDPNKRIQLSRLFIQGYK